jgi:transcriptional regulator with PAS, ATPase and Fis domain
VRLIAATNKHLETLVKQGAMRDDFFYRIYVLTIAMPPLRDHWEDIPLLIAHFLHQSGEGDPPPTLPDRIIDTLSQQEWPGNVRELYNVLHRYLQDDRLEFSDTRSTDAVARGEMMGPECDLTGLSFREAVEAYEKRLIVSALAQHRDHMAQTAASLRMPLRTLYRKIKKYHLL